MKLYDDSFIIKAIRNDYSYDSEVKPNLFEKVLVNVFNVVSSLGYFSIYIGTKIPILSSMIESVARIYSRNSVGFFLRGAYHKTQLKKLGKNVIIDTGSILWNPEVIEIDDNTHIDTYAKIEGGAAHDGSVKIGKFCHIGHNTHLHGGGKLVIGDYVGLASNVRVYSASNAHADPKNPERFVNMSVMSSPKEQHILKKPVTIENHAFVGMNSIVLPGVKICEGAVIGSGSIVTRDIPAYSVAIGVPARVIRRRTSPRKDEEKN